MNKHTIEIDGIIVEISRKPIKNLHLRIYPPDGQVKVSAPLRYRLDTIRAQIQAKINWIHHQRKQLRAQHPPLSYNTGEQLYFLGKAYTLINLPQNTRSQVSVVNDQIHCFASANATREEKEKLIQNWHRQEMKSLLPDLIHQWEPILGVQVKEWGIKSMKTRWGSCNISAHRIWLNLRLMTKPLACLEYVVIHEMIHLIEKNHNKRFYTLMDKFLPDWRHRQMLLEQ
ncbi:M48 family metallopeptidase [Legionella jamestowniensis]|uniref:Zinc metalloprotease n=1 Tax=Legionella jamestowniensis TaxID=455 RepID=A0A0W0UJI5_9GAMM|nr:SprT family zinc-dependent metalloprotease [Legionella jamestowniensis]KTD08065.1 zinc metalloprotease [Legionella jamestowniensis]OCH97344.1 zinc metalloprotease [Legionella jamestowniensis]SFM05787.1 hypothetical protein SAMN02746073_0172 [Legionella jamestowniensis DSM 19215]